MQPSPAQRSTHATFKVQRLRKADHTWVTKAVAPTASFAEEKLLALAALHEHKASRWRVCSGSIVLVERGASECRA